ncbi:ferrochelatase [bacterium]|nr:ferrochelatase [bacterium]
MYAPDTILEVNESRKATVKIDTALLLVNMGGPKSSADVKPYLKAIFADPLILGVPALLRKPLGNFIVKMRAEKVAARYDLIGGGSPLLHWTKELTGEIRELVEDESAPLRVEYAFRYTSPTLMEAITNLKKEGINRILLLPLFPHYTKAMSGSVHIEATRAAVRNNVKLVPIPAWGLHPEVLKLQQKYLNLAIAEAGEGARVLFVAHGIPVKNVRAGDNYPNEVAKTAENLGKSLPKDMPWSLAYQSRLGPVKWTEPYMEDEMARLAEESSKPIVLMPISFVADCLETLYDLDHVGAPWLKEHGVEKVVRVPAFNGDERFARILLNIAEEVDHG